MTFAQIKRANLNAGGKFFKRDVVNFFRTRFFGTVWKSNGRWNFYAYQNPAGYFDEPYVTEWSYNPRTKMISFVEASTPQLNKFYRMIEKLERRLR